MPATCLTMSQHLENYLIEYEVEVYVLHCLKHVDKPIFKVRLTQELSTPKKHTLFAV